MSSRKWYKKKRYMVPLGLFLFVGCVGETSEKPVEPAKAVAVAPSPSPSTLNVDPPPLVQEAETEVDVDKPSPKPSPTKAKPSPKPVVTKAAPVEESHDRRYSSCGKANAAGLGPYIKGKDYEYRWYEDRDNDGRVCEYK